MMAYYYLECQREKGLEEEAQKFNAVFDADQTNAEVTWGFLPKGCTASGNYGFDFIYKQHMPCPLIKFFAFLGLGLGVYPDDIPESVNHTVTIYDARKHAPGDFDKTGFTLIRLDREAETKDWRMQGGIGKRNGTDPDVEKFHHQMEPYLTKLYPHVKKIVWTHNIVRGGHEVGDQPPALGPHLDYNQDDDARKKFVAERPPLDFHWIVKESAKQYPSMLEMDILNGALNTENLTLGALLGVWKPISPAKVCDKPLTVMDASTFSPEDQIKFENSINFGAFTFNNLGGGIAFSPKQKWYYYSFQDTQEVLVFHQYSHGRFHANPHSAFVNKNCPQGTEPRISVEMRVALLF